MFDVLSQFIEFSCVIIQAVKGRKTEKSISSLVQTFEDLQLDNIYTTNLPVMLLIVSESVTLTVLLLLSSSSRRESHPDPVT